MIVFRWLLLGLAITFTGLAAHALTTDAHSGHHAFGTARSVSVRGNHLIGRNGNIVRLTGVNRSGAEYACAKGWGIWDGPTDTNSAVQAMAGWHINAVRIPLNEDCWLGVNGVKPAYSRDNYRSAIADYVTRLEGHGITPVLNLHFSAPGKTVPDDQVPMADEDHSPAFWRSLARYFRNDHRIIFDLFNEPYPDWNRDSSAAWSCVLHGGSCRGVGFRGHFGRKGFCRDERDHSGLPHVTDRPRHAARVAHQLQRGGGK